MATILFYEKPGCQNNTRQKAMLECAGHSVEAVNLLEHPWSAEELAIYLGDKPASECFNMAAPKVKSGEINPSHFTKAEAIALMLREPLLIKRPLMKIGDLYMQGFDTSKLGTVITLDAVRGGEKAIQSFKMGDMNSCPHSNNITCTK
jgi:arsenate reductase